MARSAIGGGIALPDQPPAFDSGTLVVRTNRVLPASMGAGRKPARPKEPSRDTICARVSHLHSSVSWRNHRPGNVERLRESGTFEAERFSYDAQTHLATVVALN